MQTKNEKGKLWVERAMKRVFREPTPHQSRSAPASPQGEASHKFII